MLEASEKVKLRQMAASINRRLADHATDLPGLSKEDEIKSDYKVLQPFLDNTAGLAQLRCWYVYPGGPENFLGQSERAHPALAPAVNATHLVNTFLNNTFFHYLNGPYGYFEVLRVDPVDEYGELKIRVRQRETLIGLQKTSDAFTKIWNASYRVLEIDQRPLYERVRLIPIPEIYLEVTEVPLVQVDKDAEYDGRFKPDPKMTPAQRLHWGRVMQSGTGGRKYALVVAYRPVETGAIRLPDLASPTAGSQ
jgi:hypothetical protein